MRQKASLGRAPSTDAAGIRRLSIPCITGNMLSTANGKSACDMPISTPVKLYASSRLEIPIHSAARTSGPLFASRIIQANVRTRNPVQNGISTISSRLFRARSEDEAR